MRLLFLTLWLAGLWPAPATAQSSSTEPPVILTFESFRERVIIHHPMVKQAALLTEQASAGLRMARGGFDPKAYSNWDQKNFQGKQYYNFTESGLKIPTWFGLNLKAGFQTAEGAYINPESQLPAGGQAVAGISISALRGLLIDERRATLQQARLLEARSIAERENLLNSLLQEASQAYWEWWAAYRQLDLYRRALENAQQRQSAVVASWELGDKPAIDTLESFVQVQNRQFEVQQAALEFNNAGLRLSGFLWQDGEIPLELEDRTVPESDDQQLQARLLYVLPELLNELEMRHPELRLYQLKLAELQISRRLAAEQLKPRLDLEYNFLAERFDFGYDGTHNGLGSVFAENYKIGIRFEMPLFLRKESGKLQQTDLKILETELGLRQKQLAVSNKLRAYFNEWQTTRAQVELYNETVANYRRLLDAEMQKFAIGESSIFLLNSRENKLIEAELKLIKLQAAIPKLEVAVQWAAGNLATAVK